MNPDSSRTDTAAHEEASVLSGRLEEFLGRLHEGNAPNSGRFCANCYNPTPQGFESCDHCGVEVGTGGTVAALPAAVLAMYRRKLRSESMIVNSFAFLGLGLGLALYLGLVAIGVLYLDRQLWFFVVATVIFLLASRLLAGLLGGVIGDELGFRVAQRHIEEDWRAHLAERSQQGPEGKGSEDD